MACLAAVAAGLLLAGLPRPALAADTDGPDPKEVRAAVDNAIVYLKKSQNADGSWSTQRAGPGITALIVAALLKSGVGPDDPVVAKAIGYLEKKVQKDGGVYDKFLANYTTSVALMAFSEANKDGKYDTII